MSNLREAIAQALHNTRPKCYEDFGGEDCLCSDQANVVLVVVHEHADIEAAQEHLDYLRGWYLSPGNWAEVLAAALGVDA